MPFQNLELFKKLIEQEKVIFNDTTVNAGIIQGNLHTYAKNILSTIPLELKEYTLHDIDHSLRVLKVCEKLIPKTVELNVVEITLLYYAVILHDIGMTCSADEKEKILLSPEFTIYKNKLQQDTDIDYIFRNYLRDTHVERSCEKVDNIFINPDEKLSFYYKSTNLSRFIKLLILSHGLDALDLTETKGYLCNQSIDEQTVNLQYISVLLRLGDILDLHQDRAPLSLYWHIGIKDSYSQLKWKENQSIEGLTITESIIRFSAFCNDINVERSINHYIDLIDQELPKSLLAIEKSSTSKYSLSLPNKVDRSQIKNDGSYIFNNLKFEINYDHVIRILMGTELYDQEEIFLRELIQNAYDAIRLREFIFEKEKWDSPSPKIKLSFDSTSCELTIEDNGIGIDEETLQNYVLRVGESYYSSNDFLLKSANFKPISKFGIGILSCFMVSDTMTILSKRLNASDGIEAILTLNDRYITLKPPSANIQFGTIIKLKLKEEIAQKIAIKGIYSLVEENVSILKYPISINDNGKEDTFFKNKIIVEESNFTHFGKVEIINVDNEYIEGFFVQCNQYQANQLQYKNILSQQGFVIGSNILVQSWLSPVLCNVNIKGVKTLTLKASRNKITIDENYNDLLSICTEVVIKNMEKTLAPLPYENKNAYLLNYLQRRFTIEKLFDFEKVFLSKNIQFTRYQNSKVSYPSFDEFPKQDNFSISIVPWFLSIENQKDIKKSFCDLFTSELHKDHIVIIENNFNEYLLLLAKPYIKYSSLMVSSIPGYVYHKIILDTSNEQEYINLKEESRGGLECSYENDIIDNETEQKLFCTFFNRLGYNFEPIHVNRSTLLGKLFYDNHNNNKIQIFIKKMHSLFFARIEKHPKLSDYSTVSNGSFAQRLIFNVSELSISLINNDDIISLNTLLTNELLPFFNITNIDDYLLKQFDFPKWMMVNE